MEHPCANKEMLAGTDLCDGRASYCHKCVEHSNAVVQAQNEILREKLAAALLHVKSEESMKFAARDACSATQRELKAANLLNEQYLGQIREQAKTIEAVSAAEGIAVEQHNLAAAEVKALNLQNSEMRDLLISVNQAYTMTFGGQRGPMEMMFKTIDKYLKEQHTEKPLQEAPKKCGSYWDGNQCESDEGHEGKHRFMGWTWLVSPPPLTCECGAKITPEGHACGYWKPSSGGVIEKRDHDCSKEHPGQDVYHPPAGGNLSQ